MPTRKTELQIDGVGIIRLESAALRADVAPSVGGRVVSLIEKPGEHEFLWRNRGLRLEQLPSGTEYDPNFYGGIDELLPNDIPELIDGVECPDHGELWTLPLQWTFENERLKLEGVLPRFGLRYERWLSLRGDQPILDLRYRLTNLTDAPRHFLWKMHAALDIQAGDIVECPASQAQVADLAYSRFKNLETFPWPTLEGQAVNVVPAAGNSMDFFYLFDLKAGNISWRRPGSGLKFEYQFDTKVFPFAWMFASYGGFLGHYMAIIEPCTAMPISANAAAAKGNCTTLAPGGQLETSLAIWAGREESSAS